MLDALIDIIDEKGRKTGEVLTFLEVHKRGLWHKTAHVWIYSLKGEILLQKRSEKALMYPGFWDISVAGHVDSGENPAEAAKRESEEELGVKVKISDLKEEFINKVSKKVIDKDWVNSEFQHVFSIQLNINYEDLMLQESEVEKVKFINIKDLGKEVKNENKYVPHGEYYTRIIEAIKSNL